MITEFAADVNGNATGWEIEDAVVKVEPPDPPAAAADITTPTNKNVTVTATFSSDSAVKQYSLDGATWKAYPDGGVVMENNGTVYFRGIDVSENVSEVTRFVVSNIDRIPPEAPVAKANVTAATNKDVTVTATFSADSVKKEYSLDNKTWQAYKTGVTMSANGKVYFRAADAVGNVSDVTSFTVGNIDKVAPAKPTAKADVTAATNKDVTVTAAFSADSVKKEYSLDNKTWKTYSTGVVFSQNGTAYFRGADAAGNVSEVASFTVGNIDKVAPDKPAAQADVTVKTTGKVTVTATFSADSVKREYSLDNKTWKTYSSGVVFSQNGTAYFRGADAAGNVSQVTSYAVTNITADAPDEPKKEFASSGSVAPGAGALFTPKLEAAGWYKLTGSFSGKKGSVTVTSGGKKVGSGSVKNGVITFKKDLLLDSKAVCNVTIKNTDKKSGASTYTLKLSAAELFTKGDNTDDTQGKAKTLAAGSSANDWVGYGDAVDWYRLGVDANGGFYDLDLSGIKNNVKLTIFSGGKKVKSIAASAKKPTVRLADLCLVGNSYAVIEAPKAAKAQNSDYKLTLTQKATFTGAKNNDWSKAEVLEKGATFNGTLTKAAGGDVADYCDVSKIDSLYFDMTNGKTKVSFFDKDRNKVKVAEVKMANGSVKKNVAALTLAAGNATTDHFTIAAIDDAVKYLKIEASGKTLNTYTISKLA